MKIRTSQDTIEEYNPSKITNSLINEAGLSQEKANLITKQVNHELKKLSLDTVTSILIRELVNSKLVENDLSEYVDSYARVGMPVSEIENLINLGNRSNANMQQNPETIHKYVADNSMKQYALNHLLPSELADGHRQGDYHCLSGNNNIIVKDSCGKILKVNLKEFVESIQDTCTFYAPSVNPETNNISWEKIVDARKTGHKRVYEVTFSKGYKIEVTADHKFLKFNSRDNKFSKNYDISIKDISNTQSVRIGTINKLPYESLEDYDKSALFGFFLGDGTINKNGKVQFHLRKKDKIDYILQLLDTLDIDYKLNYYKEDVTIRVTKPLYPHKTKSELIKEINFDYLGLLEGLINSDGYVTCHGGNNAPYLEFDNTNKDIMDAYWIGLLCCGIRGSYQKLERNKFNKTYPPVYRSVVQSKEVEELLNTIRLRENIVERLKNAGKTTLNSYELSGLSIKDITEIGFKDVYNLTVENNHNYLAGTNGFILVQNCHDLEYFAHRPLNCSQHDIRVFIRNGLKVDGTGDHTSIAKSPTHLETLVNHTGEILLASQQDMSGGQAMSLWNVFAAPFAHGRSYDEIKQCIQMLIYNLNMAYASRGSQVPFTSMQLEFGVPKFLKDVTAYGPGGKVVGTYGAFEEEALQLTRAITEVLMEGDAHGKPHLFPNTIYSLRPETFKGDYEEDLRLVHELSAKLGTSYYANMFPDYQGDLGNYMGCLDYNEPFTYLNKNDELVSTTIGEYVEDNLTIEHNKNGSVYDTVENHKTLTVDLETGEVIYKPILTVIRNPIPETMYKITFERGQTITCTGDHPFYKEYSEVKADDLTVGDTIQTVDLSSYNLYELKITSIEVLEDYNDFVYDIEVEDNHNFLAGTGYILSHNCRTHLSDNWTGDWETDCLRTGNLAYCTINLPRLAYNSSEPSDIFGQLDNVMSKIEEVLLIRREQGLKALNESKILPFISQVVEDEGEPYYRIENSTLSFGFNGLNEMLLSLFGVDITDNSANKFGQEVIKYINNNANRLKDETGLRWSTIQTPAESTAHRFATLDRKVYGDKAITNGVGGSEYYSNSSHVPVDTTKSIIEKIKTEEPYHRITPGGHIFHAFFGESYSDADSYLSLTEKICKNSEIGFWAYSSALSYCMRCHTVMKGLQNKCPSCGEVDNVEWYDRITGYVQQVGHAKCSNGGWNNGKRQELVDRTRYQK